MPSLHIEHLENFVTVVVDDLGGDFAHRGFLEWPAGSAVKVRSGRFVYLGAQGPLEFVVRIIRAGEEGVASAR